MKASGTGIADPIGDRPGLGTGAEARGALVLGGVALDIRRRVGQDQDHCCGTGETREACRSCSPACVGRGGEVGGDLGGADEQQQLDAPCIARGGREEGQLGQLTEQLLVNRSTAEAPDHASSREGRRHVHPSTVADSPSDRYS